MSIDAGKIERLVQQHEYAIEMKRNNHEIEARRSELDRIADAIKYEGLAVFGEDTAHEEAAVDMLKEYEHSTFEYMYGD